MNPLVVAGLSLGLPYAARAVGIPLPAILGGNSGPDADAVLGPQAVWAHEQFRAVIAAIKAALAEQQPRKAAAALAAAHAYIRVARQITGAMTEGGRKAAIGIVATDQKTYNAAAAAVGRVLGTAARAEDLGTPPKGRGKGPARKAARPRVVGGRDVDEPEVEGEEAPE